jgi:hypothetical protein
MGWGDYDSQTIEESSGGDGAGTAFIPLKPGEKAHVFVKRTDAAEADEGWRIAAEGSIEDTPDYAWIREWRKEAADTKKTFIVAGVYGFRVWVENNEGTTDKVKAVVGWRKDGVNL